MLVVNKERQVEERNEQLKRKLAEIERREERWKKVCGRAARPILIEAELSLTRGIPNGFLACDGSSVSKKEYRQLYRLIGGYYGETATHFCIPLHKQPGSPFYMCIRT